MDNIRMKDSLIFNSTTLFNPSNRRNRNQIVETWFRVTRFKIEIKKWKNQSVTSRLISEKCLSMRKMTGIRCNTYSAGFTRLLSSSTSKSFQLPERLHGATKQIIPAIFCILKRAKFKCLYEYDHDLEADRRRIKDSGIDTKLDLFINIPDDLPERRKSITIAGYATVII